MQRSDHFLCLKAGRFTAFLCFMSLSGDLRNEKSASSVKSDPKVHIYHMTFSLKMISGAFSD